MLLSTAAFLLLTPVQGQAIDTVYARLVRDATTDQRFLPANVATLPDHPSVPSPLDHFGVIAGAPRVAHTTTELYGYYRALASASPRVSVETVGRSEGGRDILLIVIADEATIAGIEQYKADVAVLADPRRIDRAEMERIVARAKPIYNLQAGQHSPEMGPPEMVPELAYRLAVSEDPTIRLIRDNVITLLSPITEPDGRDRQVEWYYRYTKDRADWDDGFPRSVPYWGKYIYHDNNRDGIQVTSELTKTSYRVYFEWHPTVMHDMHESVPLLYISSGTGPYNRHMDPITKAEWQTMANWDVQHVTQQGLPGAWTWGFYDGWWRGYQTWIAANHNGVGRFFETFGNASPDTYIRDLSGSRFAGDPVTAAQWYRPDPPPRKVLWSLRNNTNYMQAGALSSLEYAARNGQEMLRNFWQKGRNNIDRGLAEAPHAFVIPALESQRDPRRAAYLVNQLMRHGIEVHQVARSDDTLTGSFVVLSNQPYRDFAVDLLTPQEYPQDAEFPAPDVAWTLGLIYGAEVRSVDTPDVFTWTGLERVRDTVVYMSSASASGGDGDGGTWALRYTGQAELLPALAALESRNQQAQAFGAAESFAAGSTQWDVGTVILERVARADANWLGTTFGLPLTQISDVPGVLRHRIDLPRLAVYHTWVSTQDDGWVRYSLDQLQVPYTSIDKDDLRAGSLRERFDVIVVPPGRGDVSTWIHGIDSKWSPLPYTTTSEYPSHGTPSSTDDMTGGPGFEGLAELERFLDGGGTVITLANGGNLVVGTGLVRELTPLNAAGLVHPTSVVQVTARRPDHPVMYGYPAVTHVLRGNGPLWRTARRDRSTLVLQYGTGPQADERDTLVAEIVGMPESAGGSDVPAQAPQREESGPYVLSGMVRNSDRIVGHGAVFDVPAGRNHAGRVIVFTFNPMHRYLNHHDAPMLLNAILYWNDVTATSPGAS